MSQQLYLLDTNVILALIRGKILGAFIDTTFGLTSAKTRPLVSIVSHAEIRVIASRRSWRQEKIKALQTALDHLVTVDINDEAVIQAYVEIDLFSQGHPAGARNMGKNDLWIAACAKAAGATLLTTDRDFDHLNPMLLSVESIDPNSSL